MAEQRSGGGEEEEAEEDEGGIVEEERTAVKSAWDAVQEVAGRLARARGTQERHRLLRELEETQRRHYVHFHVGCDGCGVSE